MSLRPMSILPLRGGDLVVIEAPVDLQDRIDDAQTDGDATIEVQPRQGAARTIDVADIAGRAQLSSAVHDDGTEEFEPEPPS